MIELIKGVVILLASLIVFSITIAIGVLYTVPFSFYEWKHKGFFKGFFMCWVNRIDGTLFNIGAYLGEGAVRYDKIGNVWGEWVEDSTTAKDETTFGDADTTISASIGYLEHNNIPMNKRGSRLSEVLNIVFMQKKHALGSWIYKVKVQEVVDANHYQSIKKKK